MRACSTLLAAILLVPAVAGAPGPPPGLATLFPLEAEVRLDGTGVAHLPLPAEVLQACRGDLSDLRLFDMRDAEVPYLLDRGLAPEEEVRKTQRFSAEILEADQSSWGRQFRLRRETFTITTPTVEKEGWDLVIETGRRQFVRRVRVYTASGGGAGTLLADGSFFRLPRADGAAKMRLSLPRLQADALRIVLEGEDMRYLSPAFHYERTAVLRGYRGLSVPLAQVSISGGKGRTTLVVSRPAGVVLDLLRLETASPLFERAVTVWDARKGEADRRLARGTVLRVPADDPVESLEIAVDEARGEQLRIEIDDGDSPPLEEIRVVALARQPALLFSLPPGSAGAPAGILRFGGGRAHAPRYDLARLAHPAAGRSGEPETEAVSILLDASRLVPASLSPIRANPRFDPSPALAFAMHPGAPVDSRRFRYQVGLEVPSSREGLVRFRPGAEALARLRPDLADLRVVDAESRQWPYLVHLRAGHVIVALQYVRKEEEGRSVYRMEPATAPLTLDRIEMDPIVDFFDRSFRLEGRTEEGDWTRIASGRLVRGIGEAGPAAIAFPPSRVVSLRLTVEDGNDAPLEFRSARARAPVPEIFLTTPPGRYRMILGDPGAGPPRYELERVRGLVLAADAVEAEAGSLEPNPEFSRATALGTDEGLKKVLLWGALVAAVLVLGGLTLRLARREPDDN